MLKAATEHPEMWTGIAPFMAFDGWEPPPVPNLVGTHLKRILFGISPDDPGLKQLRATASAAYRKRNCNGENARTPWMDRANFYSNGDRGGSLEL